MDATMGSNLTVGPPLEALVYKTDASVLPQRTRFTENSEYLRNLRVAWDQKLKEAFHQLPPLAWAANWDASGQPPAPPLKGAPAPAPDAVQPTVEQSPGVQQMQDQPPPFVS